MSSRVGRRWWVVTALSHSRACHGFILLGAGLFLLSGENWKDETPKAQRG
jgi:hypothetical protein